MKSQGNTNMVEYIQNGLKDKSPDMLMLETLLQNWKEEDKIDLLAIFTLPHHWKPNLFIS